jgi:RNA polymerase sigma-70 factor, ECF subfamily
MKSVLGMNHGEQDFDSWLRGADTVFTDALRAGLDVDGVLARIKSRAMARELAAPVRPAAVEAPQETSYPELDLPVAAAVEGDPQAVERLLTAIRPLVVRYCRARVGRFASADDVAQEVCVAVLKALPTYRDQGRSFLAFVYGVAHHKVADAHRAARRNRTDSFAEVPEEVEGTIGPEQRALQVELAERMTQLLGTLPDRQREILVLRVVVGLSADETAAAMGSTAGAIRVAQHRALARLRKVLTVQRAS